MTTGEVAMNKVILKAEDLDGFLTARDKEHIAGMDDLYREALHFFSLLSSGDLPSGDPPSGDPPSGGTGGPDRKRVEENLIRLYNGMGKKMQEICAAEPGMQVYSFVMPPENQSEASRLISKLRDARTENQEFVYYIQRAYELLFKLAYSGAGGAGKNYFIIKTPVTVPVQNYAVHKITDVDGAIENTVMCVMLRGSLLPSMIMSKEIQEYSSHGYVTPFALFRIRRDDSKQEHNMEYILDLDRSYFDLSRLDGKDLVFADPMNATGGSLVTVVKYLLDQGVRPQSVQFFNVISALKGALRSVRALANCRVYTLWMDPVLNHAAYILPGLGDAGDRINGRDADENPRNIIQLIADYGANIAGLYREQIREIETTVLGGRR